MQKRVLSHLATYGLRLRKLAGALLPRRMQGLGVAAFILALVYAGLFLIPTQSRKVLRIYSWAHYVPQSVIAAFEKREGVRVIYDVFDATETMEAKLLAARSGYDVVFAPTFPTAALFVPARIFSKLDVKKLRNHHLLDPTLMRRLKAVDPEGCYVIPYLWGTTGMIYHEARIKACAGDTPLPLDSWQLLFNVRYARQLETCRLVLLESASDVFPDVLLAMGCPPASRSLKDLNAAASMLLHVRPYVYRFSADILQDLLAERVGVAEVYSTYAHMAINHLKRTKGASPYRYVLPKEGAQMWVDVMAIPKDAPEPALAHKFLDYLMQPEVIAAATNQTYAAGAVMGARMFVKQAIRDNPAIYPSPAVMSRLHLDKPSSRTYERLRLRLWTLVRTGFL